MTRDEWLKLAARCEAATGADREIDCGMAVLLGWEKQHASGFGGFWLSPEKRMRVVPIWTDSLDAITALIERELPAAWAWTLGQNIHHRTWCVSINNLDDDGAPYSVCWGQTRATPALALCAAFCRAMAEKEPT